MAVFKCIRFDRLVAKKILLENGYIYTARSKKTIQRITDGCETIAAVTWAGKFAEIKLEEVGPIVKICSEFYVNDKDKLIPATAYKPNGYNDDRVFIKYVLKKVYKYKDPYMYRAVLVNKQVPQMLIKYVPQTNTKPTPVPLKFIKRKAFRYLQNVNGLSMKEAAQELGFQKIDHFLEFLAELKLQGKIKSIRIL